MRVPARGHRGPSGIANVWQRVHDEAAARGENSYVDPETSYTVFTSVGLKRQRKCCGRGCRHCPYHHERVPLGLRPRRIQRPALLVDFEAGRHRPPFRVLPFPGGPAPGAGGPPDDVVLFAAFDAATRRTRDGVDIARVVAEAEELGAPLVGVPLARGDSLVRRLAEAVEALGAVWGDACIQSIGLDEDGAVPWEARSLVDALAAAHVGGSLDEAGFRARFRGDFRIERAPRAAGETDSDAVACGRLEQHSS